MATPLIYQNQLYSPNSIYVIYHIHKLPGRVKKWATASPKFWLSIETFDFLVLPAFATQIQSMAILLRPSSYFRYPQTLSYSTIYKFPIKT